MVKDGVHYSVYVCVCVHVYVLKVLHVCSTGGEGGGTACVKTGAVFPCCTVCMHVLFLPLVLCMCVCVCVCAGTDFTCVTLLVLFLPVALFVCMCCFYLLYCVCVCRY